MTTTLSDIALPTFLGGLSALKRILEKAKAHIEEKKIEPRALLDARLYPDMFPFVRQVQVATDLARRGCDRLADKEPSQFKDEEVDFSQLIARVESTIVYVEAADRAAIDAAEARKVILDLGQKLEFTGRSFLLTFALPNFYFHLTTAYALLRHNGIEVGKRDVIEPLIAAGGVHM